MEIMASGKPGPYWTAVLLLFFIPALILVGLDFNYSNPAYAAIDQQNGHLPTIRYFASHWGAIDIGHSTRSGPGYYLLFGAIDRWITDNVVGLRFFNLLVTAILIGIWAFSLNSICGSALAVALAAPFLFCDSVYTRGLWLSTDNLAWTGVLAVMLLALRPQLTGAGIAAIALVVPALVSVRQIHAWVIPFLALAALAASGKRRAALTAAAVAPAVLVIAWLVFTWHGLEPPGTQGRYSGFSLAPFPMVFSLFGVLGLFYATAVWPAIKEKWRENRASFKPFLLSGIVAGMLAGIIPHTTFVPFFRRSGIWLLARHTPIFFGRSLAIALLTIFGGLVGGLFFMALNRRDRLIFGAALLCFTAVQCANRSIFERYYEPLILIVLGLASARISAGASPGADWKRRGAGPAILAVVQAGFTVWRLSGH